MMCTRPYLKEVQDMRRESLKMLRHTDPVFSWKQKAVRQNGKQFAIGMLSSELSEVTGISVTRVTNEPAKPSKTHHPFM